MSGAIDVTALGERGHYPAWEGGGRDVLGTYKSRPAVRGISSPGRIRKLDFQEGFRVTWPQTALDAIFATEFIDATRRIDDLLVTGIKRVTG